MVGHGGLMSMAWAWVHMHMAGMHVHVLMIAELHGCMGLGSSGIFIIYVGAMG